jgi:hypothetical protein
MTLWMSTRPTQWFLVPEHAAWPDGGTPVQDMGGQMRDADLAGLMSYKVRPGEAQAFAEAATLALQAKLDERTAENERRRNATGETSPSEQMAELLAPLAERFSTREKATEFLASFGLDLDRLEQADSDTIAVLAKDILEPLVHALEGPDGRQEALDAMQTALRDHGMGAAADRLAGAPEEVSSFLDELKGR